MTSTIASFSPQHRVFTIIQHNILNGWIGVGFCFCLNLHTSCHIPVDQAGYHDWASTCNIAIRRKEIICSWCNNKQYFVQYSIYIVKIYNQYYLTLGTLCLACVCVCVCVCVYVTVRIIITKSCHVTHKQLYICAHTHTRMHACTHSQFRNEVNGKSRLDKVVHWTPD